MDPLLLLAAIIPALPVVSFLVYSLLALISGRRPREEEEGATEDLVFVFVVPCLNEQEVIESSLGRLLDMPGSNWVVLVVDDDSDDATADLVRRYEAASARVHLLHRESPESRQGKGMALNAAYRHIRNHSPFPGRSDDEIVVGVVDADGRLRPDALSKVAPFFRDPRTAAVQIGVRMYNRRAGWLARMQDMEFLVFTEIFQRARNTYGNVGLGGNGQFVRLSALHTLSGPWTEYLTEDLDMGLRLQARGWRSAFTPETYVSQQGLTRISALMRQRTRWYQGHLQCWSRIPSILASGHLSVGRAVDLVVYLVAPASVLLITLSLLAFIPSMVTLLIENWDNTMATFLAHHAMLAWWYLLILAVVPLIGLLYSRASMRTEDGTGLMTALGYAALFTLYAYLWLPVGWRATLRLISGHRSWAKTNRLPDEAPDGEDERISMAAGTGLTEPDARDRPMPTSALRMADSMSHSPSAWPITPSPMTGTAAPSPRRAIPHPSQVATTRMAARRQEPPPGMMDPTTKQEGEPAAAIEPAAPNPYPSKKAAPLSTGPITSRPPRSEGMTTVPLSGPDTASAVAAAADRLAATAGPISAAAAAAALAPARARSGPWADAWYASGDGRGSTEQGSQDKPVHLRGPRGRDRRRKDQALGGGRPGRVLSESPGEGPAGMHAER